jgi:hypothetical protein
MSVVPPKAAVKSGQWSAADQTRLVLMAMANDPTLSEPCGDAGPCGKSAPGVSGLLQVGRCGLQVHRQSLNAALVQTSTPLATKAIRGRVIGKALLGSGDSQR